MNYEQLVAAGKALIKMTVPTKDRLEMGLLALQACGPPQRGRPEINSRTRELVSLEQFAEDLGGFAVRTLSDYRAVAHKWVGHRTPENWPWSVLTMLADNEDKDDLVIECEDKLGEVTSRNLRALFGMRGDEQAERDERSESIVNDLFPAVNEGCPITDLTIEAFERVIYPTLELWPGFTRDFRPEVIKKFIAEDTRPPDCALSKDSLLTHLTLIKTQIARYIRDIEKEV